MNLSFLHQEVKNRENNPGEHVLLEAYEQRYTDGSSEILDDLIRWIDQPEET